MNVFISWSGPRSGAVAEALHKWIPKIINAVKPWLSTTDIDKGARWASDVAIKLEASKAGIICLTPSNLHSDWVLFEAGALSKTLQNTFVCTLLIGLEPSDVKGPLAQFQATRAMKEDVLKLLQTLNQGLGEAALPANHIEEAFEVWWPKLESELRLLPPDDSTTRPHRSERELLEEILDFVRNQNRSIAAGITEEDRDQIVVGRAHKIIFGKRNVRSVSTERRKGPNIVITVDLEKGGKYEVTLPKDIALDEVATRTEAQISAAEAKAKPETDLSSLDEEDEGRDMENS
jgi:hypothetical protein